MVIDGDVKVLPAAMMFAAKATVGTNLDFGKAAQLLDIEVEQIARSGMFITLDGNGRLQIAHAVQPRRRRMRLTVARLRPVSLAM